MCQMNFMLYVRSPDPFLLGWPARLGLACILWAVPLAVLSGAHNLLGLLTLHDSVKIIA